MTTAAKLEKRRLAAGALGLIAGTVLVLGAISYGLSGNYHHSSHGIFLIGLIIFFDSVHYLVEGQSLFTRIWHHKLFALRPLLAGLAIELLLDVVGVFLFLNWIYPMFEGVKGLFVYSLAAPLGLLFLYESYTAVAVVLRQWFRSPARFDLPRKRKRHLARLLGAGGLILLLATWLLLDHSEVNPWYTQVVYGFGVWGVLEYLGWRRGQETLLSHLLKGDLVPPAAILFLTFTVAWGWEAFNAVLGSWIYINLPENAIMLAGDVPFIALVQWPFLYVLFLSLYRTLFLPRRDPCLW